MIATTRDENVVIIELQREDRRNALNLELCNAIREAADQAVADGARVLVVTGKGSAFCAGADLSGVYGPDFLDALYGMLHHLTKLPVPIIAAVNGPAIGAGTQLAMACDLRVADDKAKFAVPVARNGMAVDAWTIRTLAQLAGMGPARRLMLSADTLDRKQAIDCGLADAHGGLKYAVAWAHEIAALAPLAIAHSKLVLNGSPADDEVIEQSFRAVWESADVKEAAQARLEKRAPVFEGR
ncbi:enoyl-CoA hydratase [Aeromicrobium stalagmiti]|uniref:enoyl-CoA hydratase n=1 Tax=Aeromicrobium stalagmiti TaxID=2738988 RepID=UPI001568DE74|nr:enoyl-CoA hydratase [Aeromicrobium stalagmiti]NRQ50269.1 enoyl-CoA hydratase [Aeromicrobium stalagmiti]